MTTFCLLSLRYLCAITLRQRWLSLFLSHLSVFQVKEAWKLSLEETGHQHQHPKQHPNQRAIYSAPGRVICKILVKLTLDYQSQRLSLPASHLLPRSATSPLLGLFLNSCIRLPSGRQASLLSLLLSSLFTPVCVSVCGNFDSSVLSSIGHSLAYSYLRIRW